MGKSKVDGAARYLKTHEWARVEGDVVVIGISDHAQDAMGDLVYVELPKVGDALTAGERFGVVESVKAASDVYLPISGSVLETNSALESAPDGVNRDPYGAGWLIKIKPDNLSDLDALMDAAAYQKQLDSEEK